MNQHEAPAFTVATLGHPANGYVIIKTTEGYWRYVHNGQVVNDENFRAGWQEPLPTEEEREALFEVFKAGYEAASAYWLPLVDDTENARDYDEQDIRDDFDVWLDAQYAEFDTSTSISNRLTDAINEVTERRPWLTGDRFMEEVERVEAAGAGDAGSSSASRDDDPTPDA